MSELDAILSDEISDLWSINDRVEILEKAVFNKIESHIGYPPSLKFDWREETRNKLIYLNSRIEKLERCI